MAFNLHAAWTDEEREYYKEKYGKNTLSSQERTQEETFFLFSGDTIALFTKIYGKDALKRLNYIMSSINAVKEDSLYKKLSTIDKIVNRIHFSSDDKHWKKENYWATPLETIGTNYGDTEDIALLKYFLMVQVGIDPRDIQIIKKNTLFVRKHKEYEENISLFYFTKKSINPLVFDYIFREGKIYKFEEQFTYQYIKKAPHRKWDMILDKNRNVSDFDFMTHFVSEEENGKEKRDQIDVFY